MAWNLIQGEREAPYAVGVQSADSTYPLLDLNWRNDGPVCSLAEDFLRTVRVEFPLDHIQTVATLRNRLGRERA